MRKDMSRVVIERPRWGHSLPSMKTKRRLRGSVAEEDYDDLPQKMGKGKKYLKGADKSFSDFLNPLERFLRSNTGRPWDTVYSELCEHLDRRKTTGAHVFQHLFDFVAVQCYFDDDGDLWVIEKDGEPTLLRARRYWRRYEFYVHPHSRLLCRYDPNNKPDARRKFEERKQKERRETERKQISYDQSYVRINGVWYVGDYLAEDDTNAPELPPALNVYDTPEKRLARVAEFGTRYWNGKRWMRLIGKRKCSPQELQKAGLRNANPAFRVLAWVRKMPPAISNQKELRPLCRSMRNRQAMCASSP